MLGIFHIVSNSGDMPNNLFPEYAVKQLDNYVLVHIPNDAHFNAKECTVEAMYAYMPNTSEHACLYHKFTPPTQVTYLTDAQLPQDNAFKELHALMQTMSLGN